MLRQHLSGVQCSQVGHCLIARLKLILLSQPHYFIIYINVNEAIVNECNSHTVHQASYVPVCLLLVLNYKSPFFRVLFKCNQQAISGWELCGWSFTFRLNVPLHEPCTVLNSPARHTQNSSVYRLCGSQIVIQPFLNRWNMTRQPLCLHRQDRRCQSLFPGKNLFVRPVVIEQLLSFFVLNKTLYLIVENDLRLQRVSCLEWLWSWEYCLPQTLPHGASVLQRGSLSRGLASTFIVLFGMQTDCTKRCVCPPPSGLRKHSCSGISSDASIIFSWPTTWRKSSSHTGSVVVPPDKLTL